MPEAGPSHLRDPDPRPLGRGGGAHLESVTWLASPTILLAPHTADTFMPGRHMRRASIGRFAPAVVSGPRGSQEMPPGAAKTNNNNLPFACGLELR